MEIPRLPYLPRPYRPALPQLKTVALPQLPTPNKPGSSAMSDYQNLQKYLDRRKEYFFDYNNQDQVNSVADVLINTAANLSRIPTGDTTLVSTLKQTATDSWSFIYHGMIQPLIATNQEGRWDIDGAALAMNTLVNVSETIDTVDNIYKGYVLGGGVEGVKEAIYNRRNFEFDTGNKFVDFMGEILTPTNVLLMGGAALTKAGAKAAVTAAGKTVAKGATDAAAGTVSKRLVTQMGRLYRGSMDDTIKVMQKTMNLTTADIQALKEISLHATNLKLLNAANTMKVGVNLIDDIGPKLVFGSTIFPLKTIIGSAVKIAPAAYRYVENVYHAIDPEKTVLSVVMNAPEYARQIQNVTEGAKAAGILIPEVAVEEMLAKVAIKEEKAFHNLYKKYVVAMDSDTLIRRALSDHQAKTGQIIGFEEAKAAYQLDQFTNFNKDLDALAEQLSKGEYKTFEEYNGAVSRLYHAHKEGSGVAELYERLQKLAVIRDRQSVMDMAASIRKPLSEIKQRAAANATKIFDDIKNLEGAPQDFEELKRLIFSDLEVPMSKELATALEKARVETRLWQRMLDNESIFQNQYDDAMAKIKQRLDILYSQQVLKNQQDFIKTHITETGYRSADELTQALAEIKTTLSGYTQEGDVGDWVKRADIEIGKLYDQAVKFKTAFEPYRTMAPDLASKRTLIDLQSDLSGLFDEIEEVLKELDEFSMSATGREGFKKFIGKAFNGLSGKDSAKKIMAYVEEKLAKTRKASTEKMIRDTFVNEDGVYDRAGLLSMLSDFHGKLTDTEIMAPIIEYIDTQAADGATSADIADGIKELIQTMRGYAVGTTRAAGNVPYDAEVLDNLLAHAHELKYAVERMLKDIQGDETFLKQRITRKRIGSTIAEPDDIYVRQATDAEEAMSALLDVIGEFSERFNMTDEVAMQYSKENMRVYQMQLNSAFRNLIILDNDAIQDVLDQIDTRALSPAVQVVDAIAHIPTAELQNIVELLRKGEAFVSYKGDVIPPQDLDDLAMFVDTLNDIKSSSATVMDTLEGMASVRRLYQLLDEESEVLGKDLTNHLLDAIQKEYARPAMLTQFNDPREVAMVFDIIKENINNQLRSSSNRHSFRLQDWRNHLVRLHETGKINDEAIEEYNRLFPGGMSHTAIADSYAEYLIHKNVFKDHVTSGYKTVYTDIEASGLNKYTSVIHQQSVVIPETGVYRWYINGNVAPEDGLVNDNVLRTLYGDEHSIEELREVYTAIHHNGDVDALKKWFKLPEDSPVEIVMVRAAAPGETEALLLNNANTFIKAQRPEQGQLRYAIFNGLDYDAQLINNRARALGVQGLYMHKSDIIDTRAELEKLLNIRTMTETEEERVEHILRKYLTYRASELSSTARRHGISLESLYEEQRAGQFLPTIDKKFRDAVDRLEVYFDGRYLTDEQRAKFRANPITADYLDKLEITKSNDPSLMNNMSELRLMLTEVNTTLDGIREIERNIGELRMVATKDNTAARLTPDDFFKGIPEELQAKMNVGIDLMYVNRLDGMYAPIVGTKRVIDTNIATGWFNGTATSEYSMRRMTKMGRDIEDTMALVKDPYALSLYEEAGRRIRDGARSMADLKAIQKLIVQETQRLSGFTYLSPIITQLKDATNLTAQYAITKKLWDNYVSLAKDLKHDTARTSQRMAAISEERTKDILHARRVMSPLMSDGNTAKMFLLEPHDADAKKVVEYLKRRAEMGRTTLRQIEDLQEETVSVSRLKRLIPVYDKIINVFHVAEKAVAGMDNQERGFVFLRPAAEAVNDIVGYEKIRTVMEMSPEDLASYLWHWGKGHIIFDERDLVTAAYFKSRGGVDSVDVLNNALAFEGWKHIKENREAYEALGISFYQKGDRGLVHIYIKEADVPKFTDLPFKDIDGDFSLDEALLKFQEQYTPDFLFDAGLNEHVPELLDAYKQARQHMMTMAPEARTSTLEKLDGSAIKRLRENMAALPPDLLSIDTLYKYERFTRNPFNHSVLGSIDGRRQVMPFASFNPAKTMFHAVEMLHDRVGKQTQFAMLMQSHHLKLSEISDAMTHEEIYNYLNNAKHLKLGFLQNDKTKGFKLSKVILRSPKDVQFAIDAGAVVLDYSTFNKAAEMLNRNRLPEGFIKFLDKTLVMPFKFGWLAWNYGTAFRNIVDASTKNVQSTGDMSILRDTMVMTKHYFQYRSVLDEILAIKRNANVTIDAATDMYFSGTPAMQRELYDLIEEFKKSGASSGMTKEMQRHYGDSLDRLYRRVGGETSGLSRQEFRDMMYMDEPATRALLERKFSSGAAIVTDVIQAQRDLFIYKRAYAMHKLYDGQDLTVDDFVSYLKRKDIGFIPVEHQQAFSTLLDKTKDLRVQETTFEKLMAQPFMDNAMMWNSGVEEVMRLTMYKYLRESGDTMSEAMAEIIRTHFDYAHKSQLQLYLEVLMPFSTFRFNNILYWTEELGKSSVGMEILSKFWAQSANLGEYEVEDIMLRQGVQYQMYNGNIVLNDETGLTAKVTPSVADAFQFYADPLGYMQDAFHSLGDTVHQYITMEKYSTETDEEFNNRKARTAWQLIPFVGTHVARFMKDPDRNPVAKLLLGPLFNTTWTPEMKEDHTYMKREYLYPKRNYPRRVKRYAFSTYQKYYRPQYTWRYYRPNPTRHARSMNWVYQERVGRSISKRGRNKWALMGFPTDRWTLKMKIILTRNLTRHVRLP